MDVVIGREIGIPALYITNWLRRPCSPGRGDHRQWHGLLSFRPACSPGTSARRVTARWRGLDRRQLMARNALMARSKGESTSPYTGVLNAPVSIQALFTRLHQSEASASATYAYGSQP